jgi:hypothetical protein
LQFEPIQWPNQNAHWLFSTAILFGVALYKPSWVLYVLGALIAYAFAKELLWDVHVERSQGYISALIDAGFYILGAIGSTTLLKLTHKV